MLRIPASPPAQRSGLLEFITADKAAADVEVVVDPGMNDCEFLEGLDFPEPRRRLFSSPAELIYVFDAAVAALTQVAK